MPSLPSKKNDTPWSWHDYQSWPDEERWEIIDGIAYAMSPAPSTKHQKIAGRMFSRLEQQLSGKPCQPFIAPTDVKLSEQDVVQPDIFVVCDPARITPSHIEGAPEVVIEVLSPATSSRDLREKKALYEKSGVLEYVLVDPLENYAIRFLLTDDGYDKGMVFACDELLIFERLEGLQVPLWEVFELPPPEPAAVSGE
jgi:Uma2 family endonuclease